MSVERHNLLALFLMRHDRPRTRRAYRQDLADFFGSFFDLNSDVQTGLELITAPMAEQITFTEVNRYLQHLEARELKSSTRRRRLSTVRGFFSLLVDLGLLETNPASRNLVRRIPKADAESVPVIVLTKAQAKRLVEAAFAVEGNAVLAENGRHPLAAPRDEALALTLIHGCLRRSELAGARAGHLRAVGVYWTLDLPQTKGGENQWVKLPARAVDAIEEMKAFYAAELGWTYDPATPLFRSLSRRNMGDGLKPDGVYRVVRRLARRAGLDQAIGAHTLRHTGCTLAVEGGATLQQVKTHARHKDLSTTMRYLHQRDKLRDSAADRISF